MFRVLATMPPCGCRFAPVNERHQPFSVEVEILSFFPMLVDLILVHRMYGSSPLLLSCVFQEAFSNDTSSVLNRRVLSVPLQRTEILIC